MLTSVDIVDFKSYRRAELKLGPLTVLIGANASGKSNAIEALRMLAWIAQGNRLSSIRYAVYDGDGMVRGTTKTLSRMGKNKFTLGASITDSDWYKYSISIGRTADDELHIVDERIIGLHSSVPLYQVVGGAGGVSNDIRISYNNFARGGKKPQITGTDQMAILLQLQSSAVFEAGHRSSRAVIPSTCKLYEEILRNIIFLDPQPALMRDYSFKTELRLTGNGKNLSAVLSNLCRTEDGKRDVLNFIMSLPEQDIRDISFIETPRGEVMVELEESFGGQSTKFDATLLSDGTLRVLSIASAILSAPRGTLVVIEEIDNGVHPSRAGVLLNNISNVATRRGLSVLISSHNPALLDAVPDEAVPNVVFCYRDQQDGSSSLVRLQDVPGYPSLVAQGSVGHLMTSGLIERFVKRHPGPEAKKRQAESWLADLRKSAGG